MAIPQSRATQEGVSVFREYVCGSVYVYVCVTIYVRACEGESCHCICIKGSDCFECKLSVSGLPLHSVTVLRCVGVCALSMCVCVCGSQCLDFNNNK